MDVRSYVRASLRASVRACVHAFMRMSKPDHVGTAQYFFNKTFKTYDKQPNQKS